MGGSGSSWALATWCSAPSPMTLMATRAPETTTAALAMTARSRNSRAIPPKPTLATMPSHDDRVVEEKLDRLLSEFPPAETAEQVFLGAQFDSGLAFVHFPQGHGGLGLPRRLQPLIAERLR